MKIEVPPAAEHHVPWRRPRLFEAGHTDLQAQAHAHRVRSAVRGGAKSFYVSPRKGKSGIGSKQKSTSDARLLLWQAGTPSGPRGARRPSPCWGSSSWGGSICRGVWSDGATKGRLSHGTASMMSWNSISAWAQMHLTGNRYAYRSEKHTAGLSSAWRLAARPWERFPNFSIGGPAVLIGCLAKPHLSACAHGWHGSGYRNGAN